MIGFVFGHLLVIEKADIQHRKQRWLCRCVCGNITPVSTGSLRSGNSTSCGCIRTYYKHRMIGTPTYSSWRAMMQRCYNPNHSGYDVYGGRGIVVIERWHQFLPFFEDMGIRPEGTTLDRYPHTSTIYCKENCRWATTAEQSRNRKNSKGLTDDDIRRMRLDPRGGSLVAREYGISPQLLCNIRHGRTYGNVS